MRCTGTVVALLVAAFPATAQQANRSALPRMELETTFAGPLRDTVVQRLRDPDVGTICYIYLPMTAPHTPPGQSGYVQYGPNTIGTITCVPGAATGENTKRMPAPTPRPAD